MSFPKKVNLLVWVALGVTLALAIRDVLVLVLLAILLANFLRDLGRRVAARVPLGTTACTGLVLLAQLLLFGGFCYWMGQRVAAEAEEIGRTLPQAWAAFRNQMSSLPGFEQWSQGLQSSGSVLARAQGVVSATLYSLVDVVLVAALTLFLAFQPRVYLRGFLHLVPQEHRPRAQQVIEELGKTTAAWMNGRVLLMIFTGTLTGLGLWALGVRFPTFLGVLLGLLSFVPNIGPALAAVPAALLALLDGGTDKVLQVVLLYAVLQFLDGYVLTPLVNQRSVEVPPVLDLAAQMIMGMLLGTPGLIAASPLVAVVMVTVRMLYVEDVLGDMSFADRKAESEPAPRLYTSLAGA